MIDPDAQKVIGRLNQFGYKAYIVGGCVRDLLLNRAPKDYDIVTNATPQEIRKLFVNSRVIGRRFKIIHIVFKGNKVIEVSTARSLPASREKAKNKQDLLIEHDNEYGSFKEDAARRDFTINSLFFDIRNESIIDYTGGYDDLNNKIVRNIGDENVSFPEDPVRMLRAIKFASLLGFELHSKLVAGIKKNRRLIQKASQARLHEEFNKIFRTGNSYEVFRALVETRLFDALFPILEKKYESGHSAWPKKFDQSFLGIRLQIADRMISEHEDINTSIYFAILASGYVSDLFLGDPRERKVESDIKHKLSEINAELGLTKREYERLFQIFTSQRQFHVEVDDETKSWVRAFKSKVFFPEAFTYYKIHVRANRDDAGIQRALFWEIGLRKKLPNVIRKNTPRPIKNKEREEQPARRPMGKSRRRRPSRPPRRGKRGEEKTDS